jgi:hypothetical protein
VSIRSRIFRFVAGFIGATSLVSAAATEGTNAAKPEGMIAVADEFVANAEFRSAIGLADSKLDYSTESLKHIDVALQRLHDQLPEGVDGKDLAAAGQQLQFVTFSFGSYVGEVLRRQMGPDARWDGFGSFSNEEKELFGPEENLGNAFVIRYADGVTFPLSKVLKFLQNGGEDSTYYYARVILKDASWESVD